jgi:hypothetical protein
MRGKSVTAEQIIGRLATAAHGIVTRAELLAAGLRRGQIERRIDKGALIRQYPGVYRAGHCAPSALATYTAAVKACGARALICGRAAGYLWGIVRAAVPPRPEVMAPTARKPKGLKTRRCNTVDRGDRTEFKRIPVTTVPLTLVHLAAQLDAEELARCCHEAWVKYRTTPRQVEAVLERRPNSPGAAKLRAIFGGDVKVLLSKLEKRFLQLLIEWGFPLPGTNGIVDGKYVDCRWPGKRVTVELSSFRFHNSRHAWEQDQERERQAYARGDAFRRYTYKDVFEDPARMKAELEQLLA